MKQWNLRKKQATERQHNQAAAKASKAKLTATEVSDAEKSIMAIYDYAKDAKDMMQQIALAGQSTTINMAYLQQEAGKFFPQPWPNVTTSPNTSATYYPINPQGGGSINPAPVKPGGPAMANKFKPGDKVMLTADFDGVPRGTTGTIESYGMGGAAYYQVKLDQNPHQSTGTIWHVSVGYLAIVIDPKPKNKVTFDSVIIADHKRQEILEALEQIHQQALIFDKWGFGSTIEKGRGISLLFYGPPGTGKTLMAQAIAHKLDYKLKIISTADIESSAPGQAERNIRKHFDDASAEASQKSILLFDECDSLVYTRQSVGPILGAQINELLSNIEKFEGITIFTTNRLGTLDEALNRRLALKLEFDLPTREERVEIWKRMFPKKAPLAADVDWWKLAVIQVSGGYIKNAVLRAARMAAAEKKPDKEKQISMAHLVKAAKLETEAMIKFEEARTEHNGGIGHRDGHHIVRTKTEAGDYDQS